MSEDLNVLPLSYIANQTVICCL